MCLIKLVNDNYRRENKGYSEVSTNSVDRLFDKLIWTIDDVCSATAYKKGTIYNLVSSGSIPYRKRRGKLFFIPSEILSWVKGEPHE